MKTKGDVVKRALSLIGISPVHIEPEPDDIELSLTTMEVMVARWLNYNVYLNYQFSHQPQMAQLHGVTNNHQDTLVYNLARNLSVHYAKELMPQIVKRAGAAMSSTLATVSEVSSKATQYPRRQPIGQHETLRFGAFRRYFPSVNTALNADFYLIMDEVTTIEEDFTDQLNFEETIVDFRAVANPQLSLQMASTVSNDAVIRYDVSAMESGFFYTLIRITTSFGRIMTRPRLFEIEAKVLNQPMVQRNDLTHIAGSAFSPVADYQNLPVNAQIKGIWTGVGNINFEATSQSLVNSPAQHIPLSDLNPAEELGVDIVQANNRDTIDVQALVESDIVTLRATGHVEQIGSSTLQTGINLGLEINGVLQLGSFNRIPLDGVEDDFIMQTNFRVSTGNNVALRVSPTSTAFGALSVMFTDLIITVTNIGL